MELDANPQFSTSNDHDPEGPLVDRCRRVHNDLRRELPVGVDTRWSTQGQRARTRRPSAEAS